MNDLRVEELRTHIVHSLDAFLHDDYVILCHCSATFANWYLWTRIVNKPVTCISCLAAMER